MKPKKHNFIVSFAILSFVLNSVILQPIAAHAETTLWTFNTTQYAKDHNQFSAIPSVVGKGPGSFLIVGTRSVLNPPNILILGIIEIILFNILGGQANVHCIDKDGTLLWTYTQNNSTGVKSEHMLNDKNGDGVDDVFVHFYGKKLGQYISPLNPNITATDLNGYRTILNYLNNLTPTTLITAVMIQTEKNKINQMINDSKGTLVVLSGKTGDKVFERKTFAENIDQYPQLETLTLPGLNLNGNSSQDVIYTNPRSGNVIAIE